MKISHSELRLGMLVYIKPKILDDFDPKAHRFIVISGPSKDDFGRLINEEACTRNSFGEYVRVFTPLEKMDLYDTWESLLVDVLRDFRGKSDTEIFRIQTLIDEERQQNGSHN